MVSLADDPARFGGWSEKPEGWDEPLDADGICGYVSDRFTPCELPKGHEGPHTAVALNPEPDPKAVADPSAAPSERPSSPDEALSDS